MELLGTLGVGLFGTLYVLVAFFAIYMTYQESSRVRLGNMLYSVCAYVLCLAWPLAIAAMLLSRKSHSA